LSTWSSSSIGTGDFIDPRAPCANHDPVPAFRPNFLAAMHIGGLGLVHHIASMTTPFIPDQPPRLAEVIRAMAFAGLTLWLAACAASDPSVDSASYAQPAPARRGYGGSYQPPNVGNFGPYDLPEYQGGYTPD
jgi:hypothetical protein